MREGQRTSLVAQQYVSFRADLFIEVLFSILDTVRVVIGLAVVEVEAVLIDSRRVPPIGVSKHRVCHATETGEDNMDHSHQGACYDDNNELQQATRDAKYRSANSPMSHDCLLWHVYIRG